MFKPTVANVPLSVSGIKFFELATMMELPDQSLISDYCYPLEQSDTPLIPDYAVRGIYQSIDHGLVHNFYIGDGPFHIFITGCDKGQLEMFKIPGSEKTSYWEDNQGRGYLFQIIQNQNYDN